ncbi:MAG: flagellar biosynthetic protein FliO [Dehalococcoidia bacterium]
MTRGPRPLHTRLPLRMVAAILGGLLPLLIAAPALAQTAVPQHEVGGVAGYGAWEWISLSFRIGAVLLVIWGSVIAMRWYVRRMNGEANGGLMRAMQIVETRALGPNRALHLVRIGDRAVLIGATPERINALMEIDEPAQLEQLFSGQHDTSRPVPGLFAGLATLPSMLAGVRASLAARTEAPAAVTMSAEDAFLATGEPGTMPAATVATPAPRRAMSPAGFLTGALTRLGRRMHRAPKQQVLPPVEAPASTPASPMFDEMTGALNEVPPTIAALQQALEARIAPKARNASLFERTLADAHRAQGGVPAMPAMPATPMFGAPAAPAMPAAPSASAAGLRARAGYAQAATAPSAADLAREERINELQRAIVAARRNVG